MNQFSIIVPAYNEGNNLKKLIKEIYDSLLNYKKFEIIVIDDGSKDNTYDIIQEINELYSVKLLLHNENLGQSKSIYFGITEARYKTIITIDGDGQNNPKDIPNLLKEYCSSDDISLVGGIRKKRMDSYIKILSSKIANLVRSSILNDDCPDTGCSLKVFDRDIFLELPYFDSIHRFIPALFKGYGCRTVFKTVDHRPRLSGKSKYGTLDRLFKGIFDLVRVKIIIYRFKK